MGLFKKPVDSIKAQIQQEKVKKSYDSVSRDYDNLNDVTSAGLHRVWKKNVASVIAGGQHWRILDIGCGTGDMALQIAKLNPKAKVIGVDFSEEMLLKARYRKKKNGLDNVEFSHQNAGKMDFITGEFDCVVLSFVIWTLTEREKVLKEAMRVLRPGGSIYILDYTRMDHPAAQNAMNVYHKGMVPVISTFFTGNYKDHVKIANASARSMSKKELAELMRKLGFEDVAYVAYTGGLAVCHRGKKPQT